MALFARTRDALLGSRELARTLVPVALVIAFGLGWVAFEPEFFWQDDFQTQYLPASREIARALSAGELPILTDRNWLGAGLAGEFQHGVFSVSTLLISWLVWKLGLSLAATATALQLFHLSILAAGAFRLARARELATSEATLVGVIAALNGWLIWWGKSWYPAVTSFAWVPWAWWALERALGPQRRTLDVVLAGVFLYLVFAAGWPFTTLMVVALTFCLVVRCWIETRSLLAVWPALVSGLIGLGLAAPALLMFLEYGRTTNRVATGFLLDHQWEVPLAGLGGLIMPALHSVWRSYQSNWTTRPSVELAGGLVPLCALLYAFTRPGLRTLRGLRFDAVVALLALLCAALPSVRPFQSSFRWLPLAHLALALVGANCLQQLAKSEYRVRFWQNRPLLPVALLGSVSIALVTFLGLGDKSDTFGVTRRLGLTLFCLALGWVAVELIGQRVVRSWAAVGFCLASLIATYRCLPPLPDAPRWNDLEAIRANAPYRPDVRYLALFDISKLLYAVQPAEGPGHWQGGVAELRPGYTALYSDLQFANGYSAMFPWGPAELLMFGAHGEINPYHAVHLLRVESGDGGLLDLMGADGLVLADGFKGELDGLANAGWKLAAIVDEGIVLERKRGSSPRVRSLPFIEVVPNRRRVRTQFREHMAGPAPLLVVGRPAGFEEFATATLSDLRENRLHSRVKVSVPEGEQSAMVMFSRPWLPGWRATLEGKPLRVERLDMLMPAVKLPPGAHGELLLEYRPVSLVNGLRIAFSTLALALAWLFAGPRVYAWIRGAVRAARERRRIAG